VRQDLAQILVRKHVGALRRMTLRLCGHMDWVVAPWMKITNHTIIAAGADPLFTGRQVTNRVHHNNVGSRARVDFG